MFQTFLFQRECLVGENDTVDSLYNGFMYPEGIKAMAEAVNLVIGYSTFSQSSM